MSAWFIGFLLVVLSAVGFGVALFGRRPIPQPAMVNAGYPRDGGDGAETVPSALLRGGPTTAVRVPGAAGPVIVQPPKDTVHLTGRDVRSPMKVRIRAAIVLAIATFGTAVLVGAVASIVVVGALLLVA